MGPERNKAEEESDREEKEKYRQAYKNLSPKDQNEVDRVNKTFNIPEHITRVTYSGQQDSDIERWKKQMPQNGD